MPYHPSITACKTTYRGTFPKNNFSCLTRGASNASVDTLAILQGKMNTWVSPILVKNITDFFKEKIRFKNEKSDRKKHFEIEKMRLL